MHNDVNFPALILVVVGCLLAASLFAYLVKPKPAKQPERDARQHGPSVSEKAADSAKVALADEVVSNMYSVVEATARDEEDRNGDRSKVTGYGEPELAERLMKAGWFKPDSFTHRGDFDFRLPHPQGRENAYHEAAARYLKSKGFRAYCHVRNAYED